MASERDTPRLPNDSQRIAIIGRTGSGKTQAAVWHLSKRNLNFLPWIIYDFKGDSLINKIDGAHHVDLGYVPEEGENGIFIVHPLPHQTEEVEEHLWKLWERQRVGIYCDEGYMMQPEGAFAALLTQGRSRHIPMIVLSQRPVWVSRFVFSESDFYQVFSMNDRRDVKTLSAFIPADFDKRLADYHSWYYDVSRNKLYQFSPVPSEDSILKVIREKLSVREIESGIKKI